MLSSTTTRMTTRMAMTDKEAYKIFFFLGMSSFAFSGLETLSFPVSSFAFSGF